MLRPMIRMTFRSRIEKERGDTDSSSSSLFHPGELCERRLRSSERVEDALRFTEYGGAGATSTLGAAADVRLDMRSGSVCKRDRLWTSRVRPRWCKGP